MPCPFTGPNMFCASPNVLSQSKNLIAFSTSSKTFVPAQKPILLNANHLLVWDKKFGADAICKSVFGMAQKIWTSPKYLGTFRRTKHNNGYHLNQIDSLAHNCPNFLLLQCVLQNHQLMWNTKGPSMSF